VADKSAGAQFARGGHLSVPIVKLQYRLRSAGECPVQWGRRGMGGGAYERG